ncbi:MAG: DDE-type integrase/transposase/recombinase [Acetobacteraceae bacterium]
MPDGTWAEAVRRAAVIRPLAAETTSRSAAVQAAADALGISVSQVYRLVRAFRRRPLTQSLVLNKPGPRPGTRVLSPEVELRIEDAIETVFKQRERPSVARLRRDIRQNCEAAGLAPPSRKAIEARISAQSLKDIVKARDGAKIAQQRFALVKPGLRPRTLLDVVQIDHTKVDIQLVDDLARAVLGRPWLTLLLDVHSRCVLGLSVSFDPPSAAGVALALAQGVLPKTEWLADRGLDLTWPMHGLPRLLHLDNGREFHSRALRRGCQQHGLGLDYRPPATPRFGGHIERLMGTLMQRVHALPGSTASNVSARGDYDSERRAVLTLREFERILVAEVLGPYHNDRHTTLGTTPAAKWAEALTSSGEADQPPDATAFVLDFLPFEMRVVRREGVRLFNVTYYDGGLASLLERPDRSCRVKYDPRDLSAVFVELPGEGHLRVPYADLGRPPVSLWEHRAAVQRLREQGRASVDEAAIFAAITEQRETLAAAQAKSKAARRAIARMPRTPRAPRSAASAPVVEAAEAQVPTVSGAEAWMTEFLP